MIQATVPAGTRQPEFPEIAIPAVSMLQGNYVSHWNQVGLPSHPSPQAGLTRAEDNGRLFKREPNEDVHDGPEEIGQGAAQREREKPTNDLPVDRPCQLLSPIETFRRHESQRPD